MRHLIFVLVLCASAPVFESSASAQQTPPDEKRIALTFDDAPRGDGPMFTGSERADALIETLSTVEAGPVAFFVTTRGIETAQGRDRILRYADAGHLIANHSHSHTWLNRTDTQAYIDDIDQAETLLEGLPNRRPWFRFPYLDEGRTLEKRNQLRAALNTRGLSNGYVTIDNYDWYIEMRWQRAVRDGRSVDLEALQNAYVGMLMGAVTFYDELAVETLGRSPAHVLLLHENDVAALFIDDLVVALRADGWTIITPDEAYAAPIASIIPQTLMTRQGHVAALAVEAGHDPRLMTHRAIEETQIDALLEELNVFGQPTE